MEHRILNTPRLLTPFQQITHRKNPRHIIQINRHIHKLPKYQLIHLLQIINKLITIITVIEPKDKKVKENPIRSIITSIFTTVIKFNIYLS